MVVLISFSSETNVYNFFFFFFLFLKYGLLMKFGVCLYCLEDFLLNVSLFFFLPDVSVVCSGSDFLGLSAVVSAVTVIFPSDVSEPHCAT